MRASVLSIAAAASILIFSGHSFAKTAACPCSPCKCSPCTCGGGGGGGKSGKSESKHHEKDKDKHGGHGSVGVGVNVDLGGVGQRKTEADPFATTHHQPVAHTEEKPKTKRIGKSEDTTFDRVELTSEKAKDEKPVSDEVPAAGSTFPVSDSTPTPATQPDSGGTKEKPKTSTFPIPGPPQPPVVNLMWPKWPKPIQDWLNKKEMAEYADAEKKRAAKDYQDSRDRSFEANKRWRELRYEKDKYALKAAGEGATKADKDNYNNAKKDFDEFQKQLEKAFPKTPEGQEKFQRLDDAEKAADKTRAAEKEAGKNIDEATKDQVKKVEDSKPPPTPPPVPPPRQAIPVPPPPR